MNYKQTVKSLIKLKINILLFILTILCSCSGQIGSNENRSAVNNNDSVPDSLNISVKSSSELNCRNIKILSSLLDSNSEKLVLFTDNELLYHPFGDISEVKLKTYFEEKYSKIIMNIEKYSLRNSEIEGEKIILNKSTIELSNNNELMYFNIADSSILLYQSIKIGISKNFFFDSFLGCKDYNFQEVKKVVFDLGYLDNKVVFSFENDILTRVEFKNYPD